jgi:hypothetical protein
MINIDLQEEVGYMCLWMYLRCLRISWSGISVCSEEVEKLDKGGVLVCPRFALPQQLHRRPEETSKNRCRPLHPHLHLHHPLLNPPPRVHTFSRLHRRLLS